MRRVFTAASGAVVLLISSVLAASGLGPLPGVLPAPQATEPRLAYADSERQVHYASVSGNPFTDDGGGSTGRVFEADTWVVEQQHRYDAEASAMRPGGTPGTGADPSTFVSTRHLPEGDVYLRLEATDDGSEARVVRLTCDAALDSHPVISGSGRQVAWATTRDGTWSIAVADLPGADTAPTGPDWCAEVGDHAELLTGDRADETWPSWLPGDGALIYSGTQDDPLGDLWTVGTAPTATPVRVTASPAAETQPTATTFGGRTRVAFATTQFRPDGSIGLVTVGPGGGAAGPVTSAYVPGSTPEVQGSEPAWGETTTDVAWIAFTSREDDPAGDVWVGYLEEDENGFGVRFEEPVLATLRRPESDPSWRSSFSGGEPTAVLSYTSDTSWAPPAEARREGIVRSDVHDVRADGSGDVRVLADRTVSAPPDGASSSPPQAMRELSPAYHPAGDQLAYASEDGAFDLFYWNLRQVIRSTSADRDAGEALPYVGGPFDAEPAWSPDGTKVAFARAAANDGFAPSRIYVADLVAGTVTRVTTEPGESPFEDHDPTWSPDGKRLLFSRWLLRDRDGADETYEERFAVSETQIWWVDVAEPGTEQELRQRRDCGEGPCDAAVAGRAPALSLDGTRLAVADLDGTVAVTGGSDDVSARGGIGVVEVDVTATPPRVLSASTLTGIRADLTATPSRATVEGTDNPSWSPDGTEVAFSAHRAGQPQQRGIWAVSAADGAGLRLVTDTQGVQDEPAYRPYADLAVTLSVPPSPDGTSVLTVSVTNAGPGLVREGQVDLELPPGLTTEGVAGCTLAGRQLTCPLPGPLPAGGAPVVVSVPVHGTTATTGPITAVVTSASPERDVTDNTATVTPGTAQGVALTVTVTPPVLWVGGLPATATFTVTNLDGRALEGVTLTTAYPALVTTSGASACTQTSATCPLGTFAPHETRVLTATIRAADATGPPQLAHLTGTVATTSSDPVPSDDTASAVIEVRAPELLVSPAVTRPGEVAFVTGRWFPPGGRVRLAWDSGVMSAPGPYTARADGTFQASVPVVADNLLGPRLLVATGVTSDPLFGDVDVGLLVTLDTVAAPSFLFRD